MKSKLPDYSILNNKDEPDRLNKLEALRQETLLKELEGTRLVELFIGLEKMETLK